jgi:hypothetical protein
MQLNRSTLIFIAALIVISGVAFALLTLTGDEADVSDTPLSTPDTNIVLYSDVTPGDIDSFSIEQRSSVTDTDADTTDAEATPDLPAQAVSFTLVDGTWQIAGENVPAQPLDGSALQSAVEELAGLVATDQFEADDLAQYGLDNATNTIAFTTGDATYSLQLGNRTPQGTRYYALIGDDTNTVSILRNANGIDRVLEFVNTPPLQPTATPSPEPALNLPGPLFENVLLQDIVRFRLDDNTVDGALVLERESGAADWQITDTPEPVEDAENRAVDGSLADIVVSGFTNLEGNDSATIEDYSTVGLDAPNYVMSIETFDDRTYRVEIGDSDATNSFYYTLVDEFEEVVFIPAEQIDTLLTVLENPPYLPPAEVTPEATSEATSEATPETTEAADG